MPSALNGLTVEYLYKQTCLDLPKYACIYIMFIMFYFLMNWYDRQTHQIL